MSSKKLFVFDLDGTIVDTVEDIAHAMNTVLLHYGLPVKLIEHYRQLIGNGTLNMVTKTLGSDSPYIDEAHVLFEIQYRDNCLVHTKPFNNIETLMQGVVSNGDNIAILTNKVQPLAELIVSALFLSLKFDAIVGLRPENRAKPNPDTLLALVNKFAANECYMIGDTVVDLQTANNAGVNSVAVLWGYSSEAELRAMNPDYIFEDIDSMSLSFGLDAAIPA